MRTFLIIPGIIAILAFSSAISNAQNVIFTVIDKATGEPFPARIHLRDAAGASVVGGKEYPYHRTHFTCPGTASLDLKPGAYSWEIEHGPEYSLAKGSFTLPADGQPASPLAIKVILERRFDLAAEGWFSGDLHVHRPIKDMDLLMRCEELNVAPVITWWNNKNLWLDKTIPADTIVQLNDTQVYDVMAGEDEREGGALLYFHLKSPLAITKSTREYPSPMKFLGMARKQAADGGKLWVDIEKPFWWDVPIWLASGQVDSIGIANNHMTRDNMYSPAKRAGRPNGWSEEAWGKSRDYKRLPSPLGNGYWSQEIYYHILNSGIRLPPSAGSASGVLPNQLGYNRVWVYLGPGKFSHSNWWEGLRAGRSFVSNGPFLRVRANDQHPGHSFKTEQGTALEIKLEAKIDGRDPIRSVEVIVNGEVRQSFTGEEFLALKKIDPLQFTESGWFLIRAISDIDDTFRFASTAPWYVEIGEPRSRVSATSSRFFLDWVRERRERARATLSDPVQRAEVLQHHDQAEKFWQAKLSTANAK